MNATESFVKCYSDIPYGIIASPKEEQGRIMEMGMVWYGIALLVAQTDGQMDPGVGSTKDNQTAPEDSVKP